MDPVTRQATQGRQPLSSLGKVALAALIINACANILPLCVHLFFGDGRLSVPLLVISALVLLTAGLVARGLPWAPLLGGIVALATTAMDIAQPENSYALLHPGMDAAHFGNLSILLASAVVALVVGVATAPRTDHRLASRQS